VNPTQDIPQGTAPDISEKPADKPCSSIASTPTEKQTHAVTALEGVPTDLTNLTIGTGLLLTASLIFWMGLYLANHIALRTLVASTGTFALVWVLYRLRIFHRPHGGLIATGSVALFAATLPFIERGFQKLDQAAKAGLAGEPAKPEGESSNTLPVPTQQKVPVPPGPTVPTPPEDDAIRELTAPAPDPSVGKIILVKQAAQILINGKKFHIKAGRKFPFKKLEDGMVTFLVGEQEVTIDAEMVSFVGQSKETPEEITRLAKVELMRRYPAIGVKNSPENAIFVARVKELQAEMPDITKDPHWPLTIGEQLAAQEGWKRADAPADDTPPLTDAPLPPPPQPAEQPISPATSDVPQEAPK